MLFLRKILSLWLMLLLLACYSCSNDDHNAPEYPDDNMSSYLELTVNMGTLPVEGRSNPSGGENGDGLEAGRGYENLIYDLSVFVYNDPGNGLNGNHPIIWKKYVTSNLNLDSIEDSGSDKSYLYYVKIPLGKEDLQKLNKVDYPLLRAAVVANAGDLTAGDRITNLHDLFDQNNYAEAWTADRKKFVMSTAFNGATHSSNDGALKEVPANNDGYIYKCKINVERVAARIDLQVTTDNFVEGEDYLRYTVDNCDNRLKITNVIPVNLMQKRSYLIKQVSRDTINLTSGFIPAGDEKTTALGEPTNYVMTPNFHDKPTVSEYDRQMWFGTSEASVLRGLDLSATLARDYKLDNSLISTNYKFDGAASKERTILITYTNENTHHKKVQLTNEVTGNKPSDYLTGLLLRVQYIPDVVYTDVNSTEEYVEGDDFYLYRPVSEEMSEKLNLYFKTQEALNAYIATLPAGSNYETQKYEKGICYYNVWIKHANVQPEENIAMKYGIVRNNIYRLSFNFKGIGRPSPDISEPYNITTRVFVKKWNFRKQDTIIM